MTSLRWVIPALVLVALAWASPAGAITGGTQVASSSDHPHQVRVLVGAAGGGAFACGGSIVNATRVVTAAHCVDFGGAVTSPSSVTVGYGSRNVGNHQAAGVTEVTILRSYAGDPSYDNDVAVLDLSVPLVGFGGANVKEIPLGSAGLLANGIGLESPAFATGWGDTSENGTSTSILRGVSLPLRLDADCSPFYSAYVAASQVCAGGRGTSTDSPNPDTCQGDSGGPLAVDDGGVAKLVGITSYGNGCGRPSTPAAYTEVSNSEVNALIIGSTPASQTRRGSDESSRRPSTPSAPAATIPVAQTVPPPAAGAATRDTTRPTAKITKLSCTRKRKCSFRVSAADAGGTVRAFAATVSRQVRACRRQGSFRYCRTNTRKKTLKPKRVSGGFTFTATLAKATYKLTAVATDAAGNRSTKLSKTFRVR